MKKVITLLLFASICIADQIYAQTTICSFFDMEDSTSTTVFVTDSGFYIETKYIVDGESNGVICIGHHTDEVLTVMQDIKYFIEHPELEFMLIRIGEEFPKLYREPDGMDEEDNVLFFPFITDGTDAWAELPIQLVEEIIRTFTAVR